MIRTDADSDYQGGYLGVDVLTINDNGGQILKTGQPGWVPTSGTKASQIVLETSYNAGYGNTSPVRAKVNYNITQCAKVGIDTTGMGVGSNSKWKRVETNAASQANINTLKPYNLDRGKAFFDNYERTDDRKARHKALRDAGLQPPFPRADKFLKNVHQGNNVQTGISTEGSYTE
tara:strand:+ start:385 stop:909 length:525 start_codon:yes stop_codon:yes gene_type:complete